MAGYRDDRGVLRERNEALEDDLARAEQKLSEQEQALQKQEAELERLRGARRGPTPRKAREAKRPHAPRAPASDPAAVAVVGTVLGDSCVRYSTGGSALQVGAGVALLLIAGVLVAISPARFFPVLMVAAPALVLVHRRGIDVWPKERRVAAWHSLGFRFGHRRLTSDRITIRNHSIRGRDSGDSSPVASLYMGGELIGKNLPREKARAIAEEIAQLCGDPPPDSLG
jgi:hypothetical protein